MIKEYLTAVKQRIELLLPDDSWKVVSSEIPLFRDKLVWITYGNGSFEWTETNNARFYGNLIIRLFYAKNTNYYQVLDIAKDIIEDMSYNDISVPGFEIITGAGQRRFATISPVQTTTAPSENNSDVLFSIVIEIPVEID
ncbi:MAG: hypothetical protein QXT97_02545 [Candidatus Diapherotrites archaeon]